TSPAVAKLRSRNAWRLRWPKKDSRDDRAGAEASLTRAGTPDPSEGLGYPHSAQDLARSSNNAPQFEQCGFGGGISIWGAAVASTAFPQREQNRSAPIRGAL